MSIPSNSSARRSAAALLVLLASLGASSQVSAQQYTYYPARGYQAPRYYSQPAYSYPRAATQTPQYYYYQQPTYAPQYATAPQANQAPEPTQTANGAQVIPTSYAVPVAEPQPVQTVQAAPAQTGYDDPYGFLSWLNSTRASYGLAPVSLDQNLSNWAAQNNNAQLARGLGHFVMGPARRQNSAAGGVFPGAMWMASPAHRAALLDPTITWIGIAAAGAYWTFNAY
ncbi:CAP domain-containing protein [Aquisphaera insulae]|uniref:CAP domain-containing protein n=1 Tax=Aquisphaera insulae TaxID=2712864 RepID=UPI0013EC6C81|nr:CAP domain-containing protein [Aquisphaera insulae]